MIVVRVPLLWLARVLVELVRDVLEALGAIMCAIGRVTLRLVWMPTVVLIVYAILVRATADVAMPLVVWLALTGAWLAATVLWLVGGILLHADRPRLDRAHIRAGPGTPSVSAERIQEWESAWRRALRYQQTTSQQADRGQQRASQSRRRHEPPSRSAAASPYEILGVKPDATQEQLRAAYRELAMRVHPDRNPGFAAEAADRFAAIHAAYELLSDPGRRVAYDRRPSGH